jgi:peptidoglycan/LPS O-acetylase OafA/YrhL
MESGFPQGAERERFEFVSGLRAAAVVGVLVFEVLALVPGIRFSHDFAHRAALSGWHGFELLLVLSGFGLAAPMLAARRRRGAAVWSFTRFTLGRIVRILPAFAVVLGALVLARHGLRNDGFSALAVQAEVTALFPLLLALFVFAPAIFGVFGALAMVAGLFTPGHAYDVGALLPFMLGIAAADVWARRIPLERFGWPALGLAAATGAGALVADPFFGSLPGPLHAHAFGLWNPLWSIAGVLLLIAAIGLRHFVRLGSLRGVAQLAALSYAIVLLAQPLGTLGFSEFGHALGTWTPAAAAAFVLLASWLLWFAVDRFFSGARHDALAAVFAARLPELAIRFGRPGAEPDARPVTRTAVSVDRPRRIGRAIASNRRAYGALPTMHPGMLATVIQRVGSQNDLRAEVEAAKERIGAARGGAYEHVPFVPAAAPQLAEFVSPQFPPRKIVSVAFVAPPAARAAKVRMHFGPQVRGARAT